MINVKIEFNNLTINHISRLATQTKLNLHAVISDNKSVFQT